MSCCVTPSDQPFPGLSSASADDLQTTSREYQSGATYTGSLRGNKKAGRGVFTWPNGASYDGEFVDNMRQGRGTQQWADGSRYTGTFCDDRRHGHGSHHWANGESYEGIFHKDRRHGTGRYTWSDGATYSGTFYMDQPEGYGTFTFPDGRRFQGLYLSGEREGPGVLTYPDGRQDVGLWHRRHLVKLCSSVDNAFTMASHEELEYSPEEHRVYIQPEGLANRLDVIQDSLPEGLVSRASTAVFHSGLHRESLAADVNTFNEGARDSPVEHGNATPQHRATPSEQGNTTPQHRATPSERSARSTPTQEGRASPADIKPPSSRASSKRPISAKSRSPPSSAQSRARSAKKRPRSEGGIAAWNNTTSCLAMQRHVLQHSVSQAAFPVDTVLAGSRDGFADPGPLETAAHRLITAAAAGCTQEVAELIHAGTVAVDVADRTGYTALLAAAVNWHQATINILLDGGADVNKLSDEGVSALGACHVFYYPVSCFKYNIAERYLSPPPELVQEPTFTAAEGLRGILARPGRAPHPPPGGDKKPGPPTVDAKKIQELRERYRGESRGAAESRGVTESLGDEDKENSGEERTLGTLKVKRSVRINVEEVLAPGPEPPTSPLDPSPGRRRRHRHEDEDDDWDSVSDVTTETGDFESVASVRNYGITVSDALIQRCATGLSTNDMVVGRQRSADSDRRSVGTARHLAMDKAHQQLMASTIALLLRRGASPNASPVPWPVLFSAVKAADVDAVRTLLSHGADTAATLSPTRGGLSALHIAAALPGDGGVTITKLLLDALADPDARATTDDSFLNTSLWSASDSEDEDEEIPDCGSDEDSQQDEWSKDPIDRKSADISGGRTPLHIACARDDNYKHAWSVVHLLLDHHGNPNLLCNGHSPLALAVRSGNDMAVDELLRYRADPCLPLTHGVGNVLCIASSTEYEHKRSPDGRIQLIDKLIAAGADILAPIPIGPKRIMGTAVDYAYYMYNLDRRIAHMPYHALTPAERDTFNARRRLLGHLGDTMRAAAVERERERLREEERSGRATRSPSPSFVYRGAGASVHSAVSGGQSGVTRSRRHGSSGSSHKDGDVRRPLLRYCYECGRSVGVRLSVCTRCKEVHYCSKACKLKAWNARHKEECVRVGGRSPSATKGDKRIDSPTPATDPDRGKPSTVKGIMNRGDQRVKNNQDGNQHRDYDYEYANEGQGHSNIQANQKTGGRGHRNNQTNQKSGGQGHSDLKGQGQKTGQRSKGRGNFKQSQGQSGFRGQEPQSQGHDLMDKVYLPKELLGKYAPQIIGQNGKAPLKGRSHSAGKMAAKGPVTITLDNGKVIYVDNYSFV